MIHNPLSIAGKNIVITGAASGIGRQCAIDFSYSGANLILLDINEEELAATKDLCNKDVCCNYYKCDLTDASLLKTVVDTMVIENGPVDGMLYAAGIEKTLPYNHLSKTDYGRIYSVNVVAAMSLLNLLTKKKYRGEHSKYVLISSITSVVGRPGVAAYAASKGAIVSLVKTLALEMASKEMTINCISPGTILTPLMQKMLDSLTEEQQEERKNGFPLGLGKPSDISATAMFLLSDGARWITGQNIIVDGGFTSR